MPPKGTARRRARARRPKLGTLGREQWLDLSDYLVHFAKGDKGYDTIMSILWTRVIKRGLKPFGCAARTKAVPPESQRVVCLSETPLGFLHRIVERRGTKFGIGFHKRFVLKNGGAPLWYLELGTPQQKAVAALMRLASKSFDPEDALWRLAPFIDFPSSRPFAYDFQWEREWRVRSDLRFEEDDVEFLFIPEESHEAAWNFFEDARNENTGPGYFCPYIDPTWSVERVSEALQATRGRGKPPIRPHPSWPW